MKYKINKLAKILGVTTNTIRRYEKMGYIVPERDESDYRWYNGNDVPRIANIRLLRKTGLYPPGYRNVSGQQPRGDKKHIGKAP